MKVCVIVCMYFDCFVGGVKEDMIIVCVGEGIVFMIGLVESYKIVFELFDSIFKMVLVCGFDVGMVFEIFLIDIVDVDVGENVGVKF